MIDSLILSRTLIKKKMKGTKNKIDEHKKSGRSLGFSRGSGQT